MQRAELDAANQTDGIRLPVDLGISDPKCIDGRVATHESDVRALDCRIQTQGFNESDIDTRCCESCARRCNYMCNLLSLLLYHAR